MYSSYGRGKVILSGEHAVVYGHPAIAMAINRGVHMTLTPAEGLTQFPPALHDERVIDLLRSRLPKTGFKFDITSNLPIGRGLGSSAAFSIALVRLMAQWRQQPLSEEQLTSDVMALEREFHGNPSGLDQTTCIQGGLIWFQRTDDGFTTSALPSPHWDWVILDSNSTGDTKKMVEGVRLRGAASTPILKRIGKITTACASHLDDQDGFGELMLQNHHDLRDLGVSNSKLDELVQLAMSNGAFGAKLAGAGGGGVVLVLARDAKRVLDAAQKRDIPAFQVEVDAS